MQPRELLINLSSYVRDLGAPPAAIAAYDLADKAGMCFASATVGFWDRGKMTIFGIPVTFSPDVPPGEAYLVNSVTGERLILSTARPRRRRQRLAVKRLVRETVLARRLGLEVPRW